MKPEGLHDTKSILIGHRAVYKIWKMRVIVPYSVFMAPSWSENCLKTSWAHLELLKILLTNLYIELTASKILRSTWFNKSVHLYWLYALIWVSCLINIYHFPLFLFTMALSCAKSEAKTQKENLLWGFQLCLKTVVACIQVWLCAALSWPHRIHLWQCVRGLSAHFSKSSRRK